MIALFLALAVNSGEFRLDRVRESLTGSWPHYQQTIQGIDVIGGEPGHAAVLRGVPPRARGFVWVNVAGEARPARRVIVEERRLEPHARYFDLETGVLLRDDPLFFTAHGRVFDTNPVVRLNAPALRDQNNSAGAVPDAAYSDVELTGLLPTGNLTGPNVTLVDLESPSPPQADAAQRLNFDRSQPQFEEVNAYVQIDRAQRYLQSLGYDGNRRLVAYALPVDAHAANGSDNSYFIQSSVAGRGTLFFGDGGTDDAEDADIVLHEFMHAVHDWIAPGAFTGGSDTETRAVAEGYGDYWAFSSRYAQARASGRDPFCIADWDARCAGDDPSQQCGYNEGADCLRRVDRNATMRDFLRSTAAGTEHRNGEIWSSALREIFLGLVDRHGLDEGKRLADTLVIESLFGTPPAPTYRTMGLQLLRAGRALGGRIDLAAVCRALTLREILEATDCSAAPRGELTLLQSGEQDLAIPDATPAGVTSRLVVRDTRAIEAIAVRVDIAHPVRGDLRIVLVAPDGSRFVLKQELASDRTPGVHATYGLDAQPLDSLEPLRGRIAAGEWQLVVSDVFARDSGTLQSWGLEIRFAGDAPATSRPSGVPSRVIPAVAHAAGANGSNFVSDVRLFNPASRDVTATLTFTASGADGNREFAAIRVAVPAGAVVRIDDVVRSLQSSGTGQLEVAGEVMVTSRTYTGASEGTFGQFVPAMRGEAEELIIPRLENDAEFRSNIGFAETSGSSGVVRVRLLDPAGVTVISSEEFFIAPHSHLQFGVVPKATALIASLQVISGGAQISAYGSVIENRTNDPIFVPAVRPPASARGEWAPAIGAPGALGTQWRSELWITGGTGSVEVRFRGRRVGLLVAPATVRDAVAGFGLLAVALPPRLIATSRIATGGFGQFVPFRTDANGGTLLPPAGGTGFRMNAGAGNPAAEPVSGSVISYDAAGREIARRAVTVGPQEVVQFAIEPAARVEVEGKLLAYLSVVDNLSGDAIYVPAP
jgi:subtilisin-like proprotein convertase family protein